jgi:poly(A) polymerase Pap1
MAWRYAKSAGVKNEQNVPAPITTISDSQQISEVSQSSANDVNDERSFNDDQSETQRRQSARLKTREAMKNFVTAYSKRKNAKQGYAMIELNEANEEA